MPKRSSRRADENETTDGSDGDEAEQADEKPKKNPAAVALGKLGGRKGGPARAAKLSKKRRSEIAKKAAAARWRQRSAEPVRFYAIRLQAQQGVRLRCVTTGLEADSASLRTAKARLRILIAERLAAEDEEERMHAPIHYPGVVGGEVLIEIDHPCPNHNSAKRLPNRLAREP